MPIVTEERSEVIEIEFQVWCAVCGKGICAYTEEDTKRNQKLGGKHFTVSCPLCEKEKEKLEKQVDALTAEIDGLTAEIDGLTKEIDRLQQNINQLENA